MTKTTTKCDRTYTVCLRTSEPEAEDLVAFMRERGVTRVKAAATPPGFDEFYYTHPRREVLREMVREFWGDNGDDEYIEESPPARGVEVRWGGLTYRFTAHGDASLEALLTLLEGAGDGVEAEAAEDK